VPSLCLCGEVLFIQTETAITSSFLAQSGQAQSTQYTTNTADSNLHGSLQVDPSTLGMSFNLPLGAYGGRDATLPISLTYSSKAWRVEHTFGYDGGHSF
jgi:hypothetical protein